MTCGRVCIIRPELCPAAPFCGALPNLPVEPDPEQGDMLELLKDCE